RRAALRGLRELRFADAFEPALHALADTEADVRLDGAAPAAAADVMLIGIEPMGYGVQLAFSDGHARGIYPWTYLEQLGRGEDR
ncbi:gamma-butyrobetaine hydroxylase-like domain-containing protein, partial [Paraburkholderia sp. BR14261]